MPQPNYNIDPHRITHYFDLDSGELILGENLLDRFILINEVDQESIYKLGELLVDNSIEIDTESYDRLDASDWPYRKYLMYGKWLHALVSPPEAERTNVTHDVIDRAYFLGLGPHHKSIVLPARFGSLTNFYSELDIIGYAQPGWYDSMPRDWFADYVEGVFRSKSPDETLTQAIARMALAAEGPSFDVIQSHADRPMALLEERGYADIRAWTFDDYIDWNVAFRLRNDRKPGTNDLDYLGSRNRKRGPSLKAVVRNCESVSNFQAAADERYPETVRDMEFRLKERIGLLTNRLRIGPFLLSAMRSDKFPLWHRTRIGAQYLLVDALAPDLPVETKELAAGKMWQREFVLALEGMIGRIDEISKIKKIAADLGPDIASDIWPKHDPEYLYVPR